jgi:hypothetical protein
LRNFDQDIDLDWRISARWNFAHVHGCTSSTFKVEHATGVSASDRKTHTCDMGKAVRSSRERSKWFRPPPVQAQRAAIDQLLLPTGSLVNSSAPQSHRQRPPFQFFKKFAQEKA